MAISFLSSLFVEKYQVGSGQYVRHISRQPYETKLEWLGRLNAMKQRSTSDIDKRTAFDHEVHVISQLGAEHLSVHEDLAGSNICYAMRPLIRTLRTDSLLKKLLLQSEQDLFRQRGLLGELKSIASWFRKPTKSQLEEEAKKKGAQFLNEISSAPAHFQWVKPCALPVEDLGTYHAVIFYIVKQPDGNFTLKLFDSGYGLFFHHYQLHLQKKYYCSYIEVKDIEANRLARLYQRVKLMESSGGLGLKTLHQQLLRWTRGVLVPPPPREEDPRNYTKGQKGPSCAASVFLVFFKHMMPADQYRQFNADLRLNLLIKTFRMIRWGANKEIYRLVCLEMIQKLKKPGAVPQEITGCEEEIRNLENRPPSGWSFLKALATKIDLLFCRFFAWWNVWRHYTVHQGGLNELFLQWRQIFLKDRASIENLYEMLKTVSLTPEDQEKFIAISYYIGSIIRMHYSLSSEDLNLSGGICYLIYKNLWTLPEAKRNQHYYLLNFCWSRISLSHRLEIAQGPWQRAIEQFFTRIAPPPQV